MNETRDDARPRRRREPASMVRSVIRDLVGYHLDRHDVPVKLDQNENTYGLPAPVVEELLERLAKVPFHLYPTPAQPELKRALSDVHGWPAEGILVGNGSDDLIHVVATAFLEPGRTAVAPAPSFFAYAYAAKLAGADVVEVPMREDLQYDAARLLEVVEEREPTLVFLCSPNNPTGGVLTPEEIEAVVERTPGVVVLDEAYWEFNAWNGRPLLERHPNLVLFRTFSKAMALAGARVGYLLVAPDLARELVKAQQPYPVNRLSTESALATLAHVDLVAERAREIVAARDRLFAELEAMDGVRVHPSRTNFLLFGTELGSAATFRGLLSRGVLVRDVSKHPLLKDLLRVGIGTAEENEAFLRALKETLRSEASS